MDRDVAGRPEIRRRHSPSCVVLLLSILVAPPRGGHQRLMLPSAEHLLVQLYENPLSPEVDAGEP